jgi:hypothetical protein
MALLQNAICVISLYERTACKNFQLCIRSDVIVKVETVGYGPEKLRESSQAVLKGEMTFRYVSSERSSLLYYHVKH